MAEQAPALPWAHATAPSRVRTDADTATGQLCGARLEDVGLAADCLQIEVLWTVHRHKEVVEDGADAVRHEEEVEHKWWPATITTEPKPEDSNAPGTVYEIKYEAYDTFPEARSAVRFVTERCLVDDSQAEELLFWRKRGDAWEPEIEPQPEGEDDEVEMEDGEEEEVEGDGEAQLNPFEQRIMADGLRSIMDTFKEHVAKARDEQGGDGAVDITPDMVAAVFKELNDKRVSGQR